MQRDKALLPWQQTTLVQHIAAIVHECAPPVTLIGDPVIYGNLGYAAIPDRRPGHGPVSGIETALSACPADWALIVACDMPAIRAANLNALLQETETPGYGCIVPVGETGPEPLCAVYHRACLPAIEKAMAEGRLKMRDVVKELRPRFVSGLDPACFTNLNTPAEVEDFSRR